MQNQRLVVSPIWRRHRRSCNPRASDRAPGHRHAQAGGAGALGVLQRPVPAVGYEPRLEGSRVGAGDGWRWH